MRIYTYLQNQHHSYNSSNKYTQNTESKSWVIMGYFGTNRLDCIAFFPIELQLKFLSDFHEEGNLFGPSNIAYSLSPSLYFEHLQRHLIIQCLTCSLIPLTFPDSENVLSHQLDHLP